MIYEEPKAFHPPSNILAPIPFYKVISWHPDTSFKAQVNMHDYFEVIVFSTVLMEFADPF